MRSPTPREGATAPGPRGGDHHRSRRDPAPTRRGLLGWLGAGGLGAVAGCSGGGGEGTARADADVVVGPEGRLVFEPETVTVAAGSTVTWFFDSPGHNVTCRRRDAEAASRPAGAEPFSTYGPDESPLGLVEPGEVFEHRFDVAGTYVYVCVPHERSGMVGRVVVEPAPDG